VQLLLNPRQAARLAARGGLLTALGLLLIAASALSPTADLALFSLTSLCIAVAVIELGQKQAWIVFLAIALLSLIWPGWFLSYPFWTFFGIFPIIKAALESHFAPWPARLLKQTAANLLLAAAAFIFVRTILLDQAGRFGWWIWPALFLGLQVVIVIYDYALSLMITFYLNRLHGRIRK
jgi:hypothetical protein